MIEPTRPATMQYSVLFWPVQRVAGARRRGFRLKSSALDALFTRRAASLLDQPELGRTGQVVGTRELWVHRNCRLIYDLHDGAARILRILHGAHQWPQPKDA